MKQFYFLLAAVVASFIVPLNPVAAQCSGAYPNSAQLNWDNLDYFYNSGSNTAPYGFSTPSNGNYVTNTMERNQRFAVGTSSVLMVASAAGIVKGENATHTGELANYTGEDAQFTPTANGQTLTMTFGSTVSSPNFTLYDIDQSAVFTITATDNLGLPATVNVTTQAGTILTVGIVPLIRTITATAAAAATNSNVGSATITVPGAVNSITITVTTIGTDPTFWMSDLNACVSASFPTNYHQLANNRPFVGPTQNMPDYFLVTPDNNYAYMLDPATGKARALFTDAAKTYINSFGYDPYNKYLYYITENPSLDYTNKQIKRWDLTTETSSVFIADITAAPLNVPTFNGGVESAGCAFYDGALYFGIEGGTHSTGGGSPTITTRETIVYRINLDASNNPVNAVQVFATNASTSGVGTQTSIHDWGDFIIKNGVLVDANTARNSCGGSCLTYAQSKFHHYDMMTGTVTNLYTNPGTTAWNGQIGMNWAQNFFYFRGSTSGNSVVGTYDGAGNTGAPTTVTVVGGGPAWPGNAGDASDPFRPKCDFGDAPASYDPYSTPATQSPAVHERADTMWLGTTTVEATSWSKEFYKLGVSGSDDVDNGIASVPFLQPGTSNFLTQVSLYNGTTTNVRVIAWLDFNGNGTFDAAEAATLIPAGDIAPAAGVQTRYLYWPGITTPLLAGSSTYLRVRITNATANMTTSHATGYFEKGEVEDYRVPVDNYPLATQLLDFKAALEDNTVKINWKVAEDMNVFGYDIEKSLDNTNWTKVSSAEASKANGTFSYNAIDANPLKGISYYRLRIIEAAGMNRFSAVRKISYNEFKVDLSVSPNPAREKTNVIVTTNEAGEASIELINLQGKSVLTQKRKTSNGINTYEIQFPPAMSAGMYMVKVTVGTKTIQQKLIIH